jgi:hypothetical protein
MKKFFTVMLMAVALAMPSNAQIKFGVQAGLNLSNVSVSDIKGSVDSRAGFFIGPTVKFTLPIVGLGVDASALYDQREGKAGDETIKAQSIQIPINLRYGFGLGSLAEIFAFAGPQFGFNVGSNQTLRDVAGEATKWTLKSSNLSANVGIGATVLGHLQAKFNYNFALGKTGEVEVWNSAKSIVEGSAKMNCWQISLAYLF